MARINSNIPSMVARSNLERAGFDLETRLERLATGLRINRGADDPAGLIISERIRSDIRGVEQAVRNADRASAVIATTEGSLAEVSDLLNSIRALVVEAANTGAFSSEELAANQLQIDSAIDSITRISNTATFGGLKLLDGSLDYTLSGLAASAIAKAQIFGASFIASNSLQVGVEVLASAQVGGLFMRGDHPSDPLANGTLLSSMNLRISGSRGVSEITVLSGTGLGDLAAAINNLTSLTGVRAELINPLDASSGMVFQSVDYGSSSFVSIERLGGPADPAEDTFTVYKLLDHIAWPPIPPSGSDFDWGTLIGGGSLVTAARDAGRDVSALVNGVLATGNGLELSVNAPSLSLKLLLTADKGTRPTSPTVDSTTVFNITGGGALFQLGPEVSANQQTNIGIQSIAASLLGGTLVDGTLQFLSSLKSGQTNGLANSAQRNDFTSAQDILQTAIDEVAVLRGRLGAFERNVLQTNVRSLQSAFENLTASDSLIRDADFAAETSALTRAQVLVSASTAVLALANSQSQTVLQLLG